MELFTQCDAAWPAMTTVSSLRSCSMKRVFFCAMAVGTTPPLPSGRPPSQRVSTSGRKIE